MAELIMKLVHWVDKNWFKLVIVMLGIVLIFSVFYLIKREQNIQMQISQDNIIYQEQGRCEDLAAKEKDTITADDSSEYINQYVYKYNPSIKRCVLAYTLFDGPGSLFQGTMSYEIDDLFTGEQLYFSSTLGPGNDATKENALFTEKSNYYFNQK